MLNPDGTFVRHDVVGSAGPPSPASMSHFSGSSPVPSVPPCVVPPPIQEAAGISGQFQQMTIHPAAPGSGAATGAGEPTQGLMNPPWAVPRVKLNENLI